MKMALTRTQTIGIITVVAVAGVATSLILIFDPFTPQYTLTIVNPSTTCDVSLANITVSPGDETLTGTLDSVKVKANTEITLTIHVGSGISFNGFDGIDKSAVTVVTAGQVYKIVMTKEMNLTAMWSKFC